ncbi:MAG: transporter, ATP-binding protein [Myxococcaceae bacterium]|nr:transporter, ATP-binding protein [Myxococcaceae bacterium]
MTISIDVPVLRVPLWTSAADAVRTVAADPIQLRIRDLRKSYGDYVVLEAVSFDIYRGAMNAIVGASGCGKTVLLRQLLRLEKPDAGRIEIDGVDLVPLDDVALMKERHKMGVVFQDSALLDSMSVFENVALPLREHEPHLGKRAVKERVRAGLEALGVGAAIDKLPAELSGGMKKRVAVARALITNPELLIYDEPTRGLDPISARMVDRMIASADAAVHVTSLMISHDLKSVYDIADYVSLLRNGKIELSAPRDAFFASKNPDVRAFLDASNIMFHAPGEHPINYAGRRVARA